jgi:hypothetical protein
MLFVKAMKNEGRIFATVSHSEKTKCHKTQNLKKYPINKLEQGKIYTEIKNELPVSELHHK